MAIRSSDPLPSNLLNGFQRDGYVCVDPLVDQKTIDRLSSEIERFVREVVPEMPSSRVYYEDKSDPSTLKQLQKMFEYDEFFRTLIESGPMRQIAETVLQDDVVPVNLQYFNKPAGVGKATPPHQDGYYFHLTPCEAVTGWLALEEVDHENGCIHYVRGSHKEEEFRPHGQTGVLGFSQGITDFGTEADRQGEVSFPGGPGTFLMHHAKTIHWAGANNSSNRSRRALGFIYYSANAREDVEASLRYQKSLDEQLSSAKRI